jgi:hypothetical protein
MKQCYTPKVLKECEPREHAAVQSFIMEATEAARRGLRSRRFAADDHVRPSRASFGDGKRRGCPNR